MSYTPDPTKIDQPADAGVPGSTAPAEFRALKAYIQNTIIAGLIGKAPISNPVFTGTVTAAHLAVSGTAAFGGYVTGATPPPGDSSKKFATTEFLVGLALGVPFPGSASGKWLEVTSDGTSPRWGIGAGSALAVLESINF